MSEGLASGWFASLRAGLDAGLELVEVRLALLGNELEEQKLRVADGLVLSIAGLLLLALATVLLCGFVLMLFWEGYRLVALGVMTALAAGAGVWLLRAGRDRLRSSGAMFQASLDELRADRATVRGDRGDAA